MRLHINLDEQTVRAIDEVAGKRGRSAFIREVVAQEAERRRKLKSFWRALDDYPPSRTEMTAESIRAERGRQSEASDRKVREHRDAP